jgi:lysozyme
MKHSIQEQLILHEGICLKPYKCSAGKWTIGVGRNLEDNGLYEFEKKRLLGTYELTRQEVIDILQVRHITQEEALYMLDNDIRVIKAELKNTYKWFNFLDEVRQKVIIDMRFNLGGTGFAEFKNMIQQIENNNYWKAGEEMKNSKWYSQVKTRADRLIKMMVTGQDYEL